MTPNARARPGFRPAGKFSASTLPLSTSSSSGGSGCLCVWPVFGASVYAVFGGQNARPTVGLSSNSDRNTTMPSTIDDRRRGSSRIQLL